MTSSKVALITGAGKRIGAVIARHLHAVGLDIVIHYHQSQFEAERLLEELLSLRDNSAWAFPLDLNNLSCFHEFSQQVLSVSGRLDVLVNNAAAFVATPLSKTTEEDWDRLVHLNLKAPFFLSQAFAAALKACQGTIINITDVHADKPMSLHSVYGMTKAGLVMQTKALARELGPDIRVNAVAPGLILAPEHGVISDKKKQEALIKRTALKRYGDPTAVAKAVTFLALDADYTTGEVIRVDGGRALRM